MTYRLALLLVAITISLCSSIQQTPLVFGHLEGSWLNVSKNGTLIEVWRKKSTTNWEVNSGEIKQGDTLWTEHIIVSNQAGKWLYSPLVFNQNKGKRIDFKVTEIGDSTFTAVNLHHDFPTFIHYKLEAEQLVVTLRGQSVDPKEFRLQFKKSN